MKEWEELLNRQIDETLKRIVNREKPRFPHFAQLDVMLVYLAMRAKYNGSSPLEGNEELLTILLHELQEFQKEQEANYAELLQEVKENASLEE